MNKQLSNFIGKSCGTLPRVQYQFLIYPSHDIANENLAKAQPMGIIVGTQAINHKRRIKRKLQQILKVNPRLKTIEQKTVAAAILMTSYRDQLLARIIPKKADGEITTEPTES